MLSLALDSTADGTLTAARTPSRSGGGGGGGALASPAASLTASAAATAAAAGCSPATATPRAGDETISPAQLRSLLEERMQEDKRRFETMLGALVAWREEREASNRELLERLAHKREHRVIQVHKRRLEVADAAVDELCRPPRRAGGKV